MTPNRSAAVSALTAGAGADRLRRLGQVGIAAQGVVWLLLGWIALQLALGSGGGASTDNTGAMQQLAGNGLGKVLLVVMALGLLAFAVWQVAEAVSGFRGLDLGKRTAKRVGAAAKAVIGLAFAATAVQLVLSAAVQSSSAQQTEWTVKLMAAPGGVVLMALIGLGILVLGAYLVHRGVTQSFREKLDPGVRPWVIKLGRFGYVARGIAFAVLGLLVVVAAVTNDPEQAGGLDTALTSLLGLPFGQVLLGLVALGLISFGVYQVLSARFHRQG